MVHWNEYILSEILHTQSSCCLSSFLTRLLITCPLWKVYASSVQCVYVNAPAPLHPFCPHTHLLMCVFSCFCGCRLGRDGSFPQFNKSIKPQEPNENTHTHQRYTTSAYITHTNAVLTAQAPADICALSMKANTRIRYERRLYMKGFWLDQILITPLKPPKSSNHLRPQAFLNLYGLFTPSCF